MENSKDVFNNFKNEGVFISSSKSLSAKLLKACFMNFIQKDSVYKRSYLQKNYNYAFDGYSYRGQPDSSNQADDDMLDTFVFSDFQEVEEYPEAFWPYFKKEWKDTVQQIEKIESEILKQIGLGYLNLQDFGHMVSANYYPPTKVFTFKGDNNTRLSAHPDVSLLTVFPFGVTDGFSYQLPSGEWKALAANNNWTCFPGYLTEVLTDGKIKALNHRVDLPKEADKQRYSFAFFSLPKPETVLKTKFGPLGAESYFKMYLDLF